MIATLIIVFREIFEIALLLSVIMVATVNLPKRWLVVTLGLGFGLLGSALVALFTSQITDMAEGMGQELFNALILLAATLMVGWTVIWMARHAKELSKNIKNLGKRIVDGDANIYAMSVVIALAVLREGAEIILFLNGMAASGASKLDLILGASLGLALGSFAGLMLYLGLLKISPKYVFRVTTWLLILVAGGMASIAAGYLVSAGYFSEFSEVLWDSSWLLSEANILGKTLHVLIGYSEKPMQIQAVFYLLTILILLAGVYLSRPGNKNAQKKEQKTKALEKLQDVMRPYKNKLSMVDDFLASRK